MTCQVIEIKHKRCTLGHYGHGPYIVDDKLWHVECGACGELLNPIKVLIDLAVEENRYEQKIKMLNEQIRTLENRVRTKCEHCGRMTRIHS